MAKGKYADWLTDDGLTMLRGWAREGLTDEQIAKNIGINIGTLYEWKRKYPQINEALKKGKAIIDNEVEEALIKSALGYDYTETTREFGEITKTVEKHVQPNVTALIFWLKNRRPDLWRDKQDVHVDKTVATEKTKLDDLIEQMRGDSG